MSTLIGKQAVVVGAGIGGLAAAGAVADRFEKVIVLERDALPPEASHRAGTPQGRHVHALLSSGQQALTEIAPDFERDLAAAGAVPLRVGFDLRIERPGYDPFPQRALGWHNYAASRPLIERVLRLAVTRRPNVEVRAGCRVVAVEAGSDGRSVAAVRCEGETGKESVPADLIVDASGRGALTLAFLDAIGMAPPEEEVIGVDLDYASAVFAIPEDAPPDWKGLMVFPDFPEGRRGALLLPCEGGQWIASVGGRQDRPPADGDGFLDYVKGLRTPTLYNVLRRAERVSDVARFAFPASVWRHYERLPAFPRGLLPIGDAICRFNPVYGQGMTVAAQEARVLRQRLAAADSLADLAAGFFADARTVIEGPWAMAAIPDLANPATRGERPADLQRRLNFGRALLALAAQDPEIHKLTAEVQQLLKPMSAYQDPALLARVMPLTATA